MIAKKDFDIKETTKLKTYVASSPKLTNWNRTHGGPIYISVGEQIFLNITNTS